jgi:hypothetical protein
MKTRSLTALLAVLIGFLLAAALRAESTGEPSHDLKIDLTTGKEIPPEVIEKLTPDQLHELMVMKLDKSADVPWMVPIIVAIVFGMPVAIVATVLWFRRQHNRQLHQTLAMMIEKGVPIPPELLAPEQRRRPSDLRRGVVLVMTGLGVIGFFAAQRQEAWGLGLIPLLIGVGYLLVWKLDQRKQAA